MMLMKTDYQSYGQSYYTNSVDPFKKNQEIKDHRLKTSKASVYLVHLSLGTLDNKHLLSSGNAKINSVRGRNVSGPSPYPCQKVTYRSFLLHPSTQVAGVEEQLSEETAGVAHF